MLRKEKYVFIKCFWFLTNLLTLIFMSDKLPKKETEQRWSEIADKLDKFKTELDKWEKE